MTMQNRTEPVKKPEAPLLRDILHALRYYLSGRLMLVLAALAIVVGGLVGNWNWLVAAGMAPLLLAVLPCAAMCALGMGVMGICAKRAERGDGHDPDDTNRP